ncbi:hypothetical protein ISP17_15420 [Dyella ginsengisoli]|uniref:Uncharacterized protein n=1 Tax=Dyella ginsengisoli TaxID=363848 RepID=A0ABW8JW60_9GAMM
MRRLFRFLILAVLVLLAGCTRFPTATPDARFDDGLTAARIFDDCLAAHGGDMRNYPGDLDLATDGHWHTLIQRIQPVISDAGFRVTSEERYRPRDGLYAVHHHGPLGDKQVISTPAGIAVYYNGVRETDPVKLRATALTNDAFALFHFGPSFIKARATAMSRLPDAVEDGQRYYRLLATLSPGFGEAANDQVVLWIHPQTHLLYRVHLTLNGFETTQGAHVDTTFLAYRKLGPFTLPVRFDERVRGPIQIPAHEWHTTGMDRDRGWHAADVEGAQFTGKAAAPATPLPAVTAQ